MADMAQLESQIRALEARRAAGESVPQLDALYERMDAATSKAYKESSKGLSGDYTGEKSKAGESAIENMKQYGMKKGGMTVSKMEGGMKKVKKMAVGGMNASAPPTQSQLQASAPRPNFQQAVKSAGMNVPNLKTGDRSFSSTPTMGGLASLNGGNMRNMQKVDNRPAPPGTPGLQRFSTPDQYKQAKALYRQMQKQQQLANSVGRLPASPISPASPIGGAAARALGLGIKKGGAVKGYAKGGAVKSSASKRADGCAQRGKTKGKMV